MLRYVYGLFFLLFMRQSVWLTIRVLVITLKIDIEL